MPKITDADLECLDEVVKCQGNCEFAAEKMENDF